MVTTLIVISPMGETEAPLMGGPESELCFPVYKLLKGRKRLGTGSWVQSLFFLGLCVS